MFVKPRFVQFLTSVSVAAMFVATPIVGTFDAAGKLLIVSAIAHAQEENEPEPGPGPGDETPPEGPGGPIGPIGPVGPVGPIDPTPVVPVAPVVPFIPVVPVVPDVPVVQATPVVPVALAPKVQTSSSDSRDNVPSSLPAKPAVAVSAAAQEALDWAKELRCSPRCKVSVMSNGDVTVTMTTYESTPTPGNYSLTYTVNGADYSVFETTPVKAKSLVSTQTARSAAEARKELGDFINFVG